MTATAQARLGETADQLVARYGQPLSEVDQKSDGTKLALAFVVFQKGGFEVDVTLSDGKSVAELFKKLNGDPLTLTEVRTLLTVNAQGREWGPPQMGQSGKWWTRDDNATRDAGPGRFPDHSIERAGGQGRDREETRTRAQPRRLLNLGPRKTEAAPEGYSSSSAGFSISSRNSLR